MRRIFQFFYLIRKQGKNLRESSKFISYAVWNAEIAHFIKHIAIVTYIAGSATCSQFLVTVLLWTLASYISNGYRRNKEEELYSSHCVCRRTHLNYHSFVCPRSSPFNNKRIFNEFPRLSRLRSHRFFKTPVRVRMHKLNINKLRNCPYDIASFQINLTISRILSVLTFVFINSQFTINLIKPAELLF